MMDRFIIELSPYINKVIRECKAPAVDLMDDVHKGYLHGKLEVAQAIQSAMARAKQDE